MPIPPIPYTLIRVQPTPVHCKAWNSTPAEVQVGVMLLLVRWRLWSCLKPVVGIEGSKVRVVVERDFGIELAKQESIMEVKVSPTDGSVVFAEGIAGSSVSTGRASKVRESVFGGSLVLVSTGRASIGRASIAGASITGASITGASITGASIRRASKAPKVNSTGRGSGRAL
jgi:hypothetical protein